jgi:alkanesulfonate monooxygenase SsuD/methylene tetrahydromethanopterin reductase-like flavin-dependent oxidoreductase (luciferase family)
MPPSGTSGGIDHGDKTARREEWATGHPALPDLATRVQQFADEIERLRALLRQHGIDPQDKPA